MAPLHNQLRTVHHRVQHSPFDQQLRMKPSNNSSNNSTAPPSYQRPATTYRRSSDEHSRANLQNANQRPLSSTGNIGHYSTARKYASPNALPQQPNAWEEAASNQRKVSASPAAEHQASSCSSRSNQRATYTPPTPPMKHRQMVRSSHTPTQLVRPSGQLLYDTRHGPVISSPSSLTAAQRKITTRQHWYAYGIM